MQRNFFAVIGIISTDKLKKISSAISSRFILRVLQFEPLPYPYLSNKMGLPPDIHGRTTADINSTV
jgi:hypothetical protein